MEDLLSLTSTAQGAITALATAIIAVMAVVTAALTIGLIRENRLLRMAGTEPRVVAYLTTDPRHKTMVNLALANVGLGAARNVRFRFDADEQDFSSHNVELSNTTARAPIGMLPQGEKIEAFFGAGYDLYKEPRLCPFRVIVEYEDMKGRQRSETHSLDVSQFDGLITLGQPADHEIAEALKKIERHLSQFASGLTRLKVETITSAEAREEMERHAEEVRKRIERQREKERNSGKQAKAPDA